ncbi:MAG: hypothetical protein O3B64_02480 [bacterium]|nr:hypothetical protein [bacterium]MDA1024716.1 hypothetical protein [bacterium]
MQVPLSILLIPFGIMFFVSFVFFIVNIFHISRYGLQSTKTTAIIGAYLVGFFVTVLISGALLFRYDWSRTIDLGSFEFTGDIHNLKDL